MDICVYMCVSVDESTDTHIHIHIHPYSWSCSGVAWRFFVWCVYVSMHTCIYHSIPAHTVGVAEFFRWHHSWRFAWRFACACCDAFSRALPFAFFLARLLSCACMRVHARACAHPLIFSISRFPPSLAISVALLCPALSFLFPSISLWPSMCTGKIAVCQVRYYWKVCDCQHGKVRSPRSLTHTCLPRTHMNQSVEHIL